MVDQVYNQNDPAPISAPIPINGAIGEELPEVLPVLRHGFKFGNRRLLHDLGTSFEMVEPLPIFRLPNTPNWLLGLSNLRGNMLPVFDIAKYLGEVPLNREKQMQLVVGSGNNAVGIMIDGVLEQVGLDDELPVSELKDVPNIIKPFIEAAYRYRGEIWLQVNFDSMFHELSKEIVA